MTLAPVHDLILALCFIFVLGMGWKLLRRMFGKQATGEGAFWGLPAGTADAALTPDLKGLVYGLGSLDMLDLRFPIGWFFAITGLLLLAMGIFAPGLRATLTAANVNLYCGIFIALFGAFLLLLAARASRRRA